MVGQTCSQWNKFLLNWVGIERVRMNEIRGRYILREVKQRCEPFQEDFAGKKITILRFAPSSKETDAITLAKYEAARYSTDHKVKTFKFIGCEVDSQLLPHKTTIQEFEAILRAANVDPNTVGIIVQNPIPEKLKNSLSLISQELDIDGMSENHPLFKASATSETIARLVRSFADENTLVAVVGAEGFVGRGVMRLLQEDNIRCFGLDDGDDLVRTHEADIVVSATGVKELLDERHLLPKHRLVIDAGFVPISKQQILGDVKRSAYNIPQNLTPVPGGVGPLQMATLLERLIAVTTGRDIEKWTYRGVSYEAQTSMSQTSGPGTEIYYGLS